MRIHIYTTKNTSLVPFAYQQKLVGTIHKWIGENSLHDRISLYSFSWLQGGRKVSGALDFPEGATMFLSFYDDDTMRKVIKTILVVTGGYGISACFLNRNTLILNHFHYLFFSAIY